MILKFPPQFFLGGEWMQNLLINFVLPYYHFKNTCSIRLLYPKKLLAISKYKYMYICTCRCYQQEENFHVHVTLKLIHIQEIYNVTHHYWYYWDVWKTFVALGTYVIIKFCIWVFFFFMYLMPLNSNPLIILLLKFIIKIPFKQILKWIW